MTMPHAAERNYVRRYAVNRAVKKQAFISRKREDERAFCIPRQAGRRLIDRAAHSISARRLRQSRRQQTNRSSS